MTIPISRRDYFAAMAMQGILSARLTMNLKEIVEDSLLMADALIEELDKTQIEREIKFGRAPKPDKP